VEPDPRELKKTYSRHSLRVLGNVRTATAENVTDQPELDSRKPEAPKKPYTTPRLIVYGNLSSITRSNATGPNSDAGRVDVKTT
jgi:hypothetical protein